MAHSLAKNWLHIIFSTKNRQALISPGGLEAKIYGIIKEETKSMDCRLDSINGMPDHVHVLVLLHPSKSLADYVKQIKGVSTRRVNQSNWTPQKFGWQKGYGAFSVSESQLPKVRRYIERQKTHHRNMDLDVEWNRLVEAHR